MAAPRQLFRSVLKCPRVYDVFQSKLCGISGRRAFLSQAYNCEEAWNRRLSEPVIDKIKFGNYYVELDGKFISNKKISAIDLDLIVQKIVEVDHLEELMDLLNRFRRTPNTIHMLPSTPHSVIRSFLQFGQYDNLLVMLNDRLNFGIFPDYYCCNLMMDTFLQQQNSRDAAKVAILMMLQEDFGHPMSSHLALYSCLSYLRSPQPEPWETVPPPPPEPEPEEQVIIRLGYLPPNYFDDHFDLKDPVKLLGKTLAMLGSEFKDEIGNTCQIIGLGLYEKWTKLQICLEKILSDKKHIVFKEGVTRIKESIEKIPDDKNKTREKVEENIKPLIEKIEGQTIEGDILEILRTRMVAVVDQYEKEDIDKQLNLYKEWANARQQEVERQVQDYIRAARIQKVKEMKEELKKKEELLYFFENFETHAIKAGVYEKVAEKVSSRKTKQIEDAYIPPEVHQPIK